ncbi:MAG: hypothetical protein PHQ96_03325 [Candidatus Omnitrophica bacterium]|nr:hypothetical protein [Candidatus Omnitrophota bacterium]
MSSIPCLPAGRNSQTAKAYDLCSPTAAINRLLIEEKSQNKVESANGGVIEIMYKISSMKAEEGKEKAALDIRV